MMKKVRYALIGYGGIAENRIAREGFGLDASRFSPLPEAELVAVTDLDVSRKAAAERWGLHWRDSAEDIFRDGAIDAVFIATNNASHFALGMRALETGKHVILEKPAATTLDHAGKLAETAEKKSLSLAVDHMMTANAYNRKARQLVETGVLGRIGDICLHMEFLYGATPEEAGTWRCDKPEELGGPIGDVGSHCLYMAEFLSGESVRTIRAVFAPKKLDIRVEDGALIRFETENLGGTVRVSFADRRGNLENTFLNLGYEIYGDKKVLRAYGTLFQLSGHPEEPVALRLELEDGRGTDIVRLDRTENMYRRVVTGHARSIIENKRLTGYDAVHNLRLVLAAYDSARDGGRPISISEEVNT
jgi:predicted dehydrogenase